MALGLNDLLSMSWIFGILFTPKVCLLVYRRVGVYA